MSRTLRIATRKSALARFQAEWVGRLLESRGIEIRYVHVSSSGDRDQKQRLSQTAQVGFFTREITQAVTSGEADLAVHSLKDLPVDANGSLFHVVPTRQDSRDVFIPAVRHGETPLKELKRGAKIATSSPRRAALLRGIRSDFEIVEIRGNVETRLKKIDEGEADAIILAAAGINRLGIDRFKILLEHSRFPGAAGQGALAVQFGNKKLTDLLKEIECPDARLFTDAERAVLSQLGGGCHSGIGVSASKISLHGFRIDAAKADDGKIKRSFAEGTVLSELIDQVVAELS